MKNNDFEFQYSAPTNIERKEIESIRNSYLEKASGSDKLSRLRKLDSKVRNIPIVISLILGVVGILIFGLGLTMVLEWNLNIWGVIVGALGLIPTLFAYPVYYQTLKHLKNKYSNEIIKLSEELLGDNKDIND